MGAGRGQRHSSSHEAERKVPKRQKSKAKSDQKKSTFRKMHGAREKGGR